MLKKLGKYQFISIKNSIMGIMGVVRTNSYIAFSTLI